MEDHSQMVLTCLDQVRHLVATGEFETLANNIFASTNKCIGKFKIKCPHY